MSSLDATFNDRARDRGEALSIANRRRHYLLSLVIGAVLGLTVLATALFVARSGSSPVEPPVAITAIEWPPSSTPDENNALRPRHGLTPAPDSRLIEIIPEGLLPIKGEGGVTPFHVYRRWPVPVGSNEIILPEVAIILKGAGIGQLATLEAALRLPPDISFALSPYGRDLERQVDDIREAGHEFFLDVPITNSKFAQNDRGPKALMPDLAEADNLARLKWAMSRVTGYVGFLALTETDDKTPPLIEKLLSHQASMRGLGMVIDRGGETQRRASADYPQTMADQTVSRDASAAQIDTTLKALELKAQKHGYALGVAVLTPLAIERVNLWSAGIAARGFRLVPASALVKLSGP